MSSVIISSLVAKTEDFLRARESDVKHAFTFEEIKEGAELMMDFFAPNLPSEDRPSVLDKICRELQTRFTTVISESHYLTSHDCTNWLTDERKQEIIANGFWNAYKLSVAESRGERMISKIDEDTDKILGFMADPMAFMPQQKKGLVIGDVQSGKTSNYTGLICKAADAGYKIIIVIAGTISTLRAQTQERLEKDFIGKSSNDNIAEQYRNIPYGVSKFRESNMNYSVNILTNWNYDFRKSDAERSAPNFQNGNIAMLVIQKNAKTLKNVIKFFKTRLSDAEKEKLPLLVLDDEADHASPNTKGDESPSAINKSIRNLLSLFKINSYVGYTATPYANIFINPYVAPTGSDDGTMLGQELFPRDFIYCIGHSSEYIGATRLFDQSFEESAEYDEVQFNVQTISEETHFTEALKEGSYVDLPASLETAINTFVLSKAIRNIREDSDFHCSMLIHVTMKRDGHTRIKQMVDDYCHRLLQAVSQYVALNNPENYNGYIRALKTTWEEQFEDTDISETWGEVCTQMAKPGFAECFKTYKENSTTPTQKKLRFEYSKEKGLTAIVIGGNSLARGLTLEGLCTSYFLRNSRQYDTLMQMGRWFGYRHNYADICRIFITQRMQDNFAAIAQATDELKAAVNEMQEEGKTPMEFGLRVRNGISGLMITSPNKMKSADQREEWIDFSDSLCETYKIPATVDKISLNNQALLEFLNNIDAKYMRHQPTSEERQYGIIWERVPAAEAVGFLNKTKGMTFSSDPFAVSTLIKHLENRHEKIDVALIVSEQECRNGIVKTAKICGKEYRIPWRVPSSKDGDYYFIKNHPFSKIHEMGYLKASQIDELKELYIKDHPENGQRAKQIPVSSIPGRYFRRVEGRRPLLMLALMAVPEPDVANEICEARKSAKKRNERYTKMPTSEQLSRIVAVWGISFPKGDSEAQRVTYTVNAVQLKNELEERARLEQEPDEEY